MTDDERKNLEFLQNIIARLAGNSFQIKGWSVALGSLIIGFTAKDAQSQYAIVALLPVLAFWGLDGFYLALETLYRQRFNLVADLSQNSGMLFNLKVGQVTGTLWLTKVSSVSVAFVHAPVIVIAIFVSLYGPNANVMKAKSASASSIVAPIATVVTR